MSARITRNDIPDIEAVKAAMLTVLSSGRSRSFDNIAGDVAKTLGLTKEQRSFRIGKSANTLFENRLVQARADLTKERQITYKAGKIRIAKAKQSEVSVEPCENGSTPKPAAPTAQKESPSKRNTKCLSFQQPYASFIVTGVKDVEFRSKKVNVPIRDLVVCASKTPRVFPEHLAGLAYGMAIGMVDVVDCVGVQGDHIWKLENPRLIKPFKVHATAGFFYVADTPEVIPNNEESYREHVLPFCAEGALEDVDANIASLFATAPDEGQKTCGVDRDKWDLARKRRPYSKCK